MFCSGAQGVNNYTAVCNLSSISHGSSVGRAGDCNSDTAVIPRPVVRFRPVRFFDDFIACISTCDKASCIS